MQAGYQVGIVRAAFELLWKAWRGCARCELKAYSLAGGWANMNSGIEFPGVRVSAYPRDDYGDFWCMKHIRLLFVYPIFLVLLLPGCKILVDVPEGGSVASRTGENDCAAGTTCSIDVENGITFSDTFTAVPAPGYQFVGWKQGDRLLCGGSAEPCALENVPPEFTDRDIELRLIPQFEPDGSPVEVAAMLSGRLADASVTLTDLSTGETTCSARTGSASSEEPIGVAIFASTCLGDGALYLVTVSGGTDTGSDETESNVNVGQPITGSFHALVKKTQLRSGDTIASAVSEAAYQKVKFLLEIGYPEALILENLDVVARRLIRDDLSGDGTVDHKDQSAWNAIGNAAQFRGDPDTLNSLVDSIAEATSNGLDALTLTSSAATVRSSIKFDQATSKLAFYNNDLVALSAPVKYNGYGRNTFVRTLNLSDTGRLSQSGSLLEVEWRNMVDVEIEGDRAYVIGLTQGALAVALLDLSVPGSPIMLDRTFYSPSGWNVMEFSVDGDRALAALRSRTYPYSHRLQLLNLNAPLTPSVLQNIDSEGEVKEVILEGDYGYALFDRATEPGTGQLLSKANVSIYSNKNPDELLLLSAVALDNPWYAALGDDKLYVVEYPRFCCGGDSLTVVDLSDRTQATVVGRGEIGNSVVGGVSLMGDRLYMGHYSGVVAMDVSDPRAPSVSDNIPTSRVKSLLARDEVLYVAVDTGKVMALDVSRPAEPLNVGISQSNLARSATLHSEGQYVHSLSTSGRYSLIDTSNPDTPELVGQSPGYVFVGNHLAKSGDSLYANFGSTLGVVDVSDAYQASSKTLACHTTGSEFFYYGEKKIVGSLMIGVGDVVPANCTSISRESLDLVITDISSPDTPVLEGSVDLDSYWDGGVEIVGDTALAALRDDGLAIIDISSPRNPVSVGRMGTSIHGVDSDGFYDVELAGTSLLAAMGGDGLDVLDAQPILDGAVTGNFALRLRTNLPTLRFLHRVKVDGNVAYLMAGDLLYVVDFNDPADPQILAVIEANDYIVDVAITDTAIVLSTSQMMLSYRKPH